jgi:hypothetical protein
MPQDRNRDAADVGPAGDTGRARRSGGAHRRAGRGRTPRASAAAAGKHPWAALAARIAVTIILGAQILAMLLAGTYARRGPRLWGVPFFYWYSLLWLLMGAVGMAGCVWLLERFAPQASPTGATGTTGTTGTTGADRGGSRSTR